MPFPIQKIVLQTEFSTPQIMEKLHAAVFPVKTFSYPSLESMSEALHKTFAGKIDGKKFKVVLLGDIGKRINFRKGQVVVLGEVEGSTVKVTLRPPLFTLVFLSFWCAFTGFVFVLSFRGANGVGIKALLAGLFLLPLVLMIPLYNREAKTVCEKLDGIWRNVGAGGPVS